MMDTLTTERAGDPRLAYIRDYICAHRVDTLVVTGGREWSRAGRLALADATWRGTDFATMPNGSTVCLWWESRGIMPLVGRSLDAVFCMAPVGNIALLELRHRLVGKCGRLFGHGERW